jgi:hypothetical protein
MERFDLYWSKPDIVSGVVAYRSGKNVYWCNVTLPSGAVIDCGGFGGWGFVGLAQGADRFVGELDGVPAVMVKMQ